MNFSVIFLQIQSVIFLQNVREFFTCSKYRYFTHKRGTKKSRKIHAIFTENSRKNSQQNSRSVFCKKKSRIKVCKKITVRFCKKFTGKLERAVRAAWNGLRRCLGLVEIAKCHGVCTAVEATERASFARQTYFQNLESNGCSFVATL